MTGLNDLNEILLHLILSLEKLELRYALAGSVASMVYGEPRATLDIDVVVQMEVEDVDRLKEELAEPEFFLDEIAARTAIREGRPFNVLHPGSGHKIDVFPAVGALPKRTVERRRRLPAVGETLADVSPPEELIVQKMRYYREGGSEKHLRDIASMLAISAVEIDQEEIGRLASSYGLDDVWRTILDALDPPG